MHCSNFLYFAHPGRKSNTTTPAHTSTPAFFHPSIHFHPRIYVSPTEIKTTFAAYTNCILSFVSKSKETMACILTFVALTLLPITHGLASSLPNGCPASSKCPVPWMDTTIVALNLTECNPGDLVARHEGCCSCAYLDSENIPTIGIGYNLDNAGAKAAITNLGYNFSKVISGSQCLSQSAISSLWAGTRDTILFVSKYFHIVSRFSFLFLTMT